MSGFNDFSKQFITTFDTFILIVLFIALLGYYILYLVLVSIVRRGVLEALIELKIPELINNLNTKNINNIEISNTNNNVAREKRSFSISNIINKLIYNIKNSETIEILIHSKLLGILLVLLFITIILELIY